VAAVRTTTPRRARWHQCSLRPACPRWLAGARHERLAPAAQPPAGQRPGPRRRDLRPANQRPVRPRAAPRREPPAAAAPTTTGLPTRQHHRPPARASRRRLAADRHGPLVAAARPATLRPTSLHHRPARRRVRAPQVRLAAAEPASCPPRDSCRLRRWPGSRPLVPRSGPAVRREPPVVAVPSSPISGQAGSPGERPRPGSRPPNLHDPAGRPAHLVAATPSLRICRRAGERRSARPVRGRPRRSRRSRPAGPLRLGSDRCWTRSAGSSARGRAPRRPSRAYPSRRRRPTQRRRRLGWIRRPVRGCRRHGRWRAQPSACRDRTRPPAPTAHP
jgi:hypothetical protein